MFRDASDPAPAATGWATEREGDGDINTVACLENTETSAIGRALANLGFTASKYRPSVEEMRKAARVRERRRPEARIVPMSAEDEAAYASAVAELLTLLSAAERAGLARDQAERIRKRLDRRALTTEQIGELTRRARTWLERDDADRSGGEPSDARM